MILHISTNEVELTPDIKELVEKKFSTKLAKFVSHYPEDAVTMNLFIAKGDRWGFKVSCEVDIPGENMHAEEVHKELSYAINALTKELQRRLRKKKEKSLEN